MVATEERARVQGPVRDIQLTVRLTAEEHESLARIATERGVPMTGVVRGFIREAAKATGEAEYRRPPVGMPKGWQSGGEGA